MGIKSKKPTFNGELVSRGCLLGSTRFAGAKGCTRGGSELHYQNPTNTLGGSNGSVEGKL
jgi:hypothetical protein